MIEGTSRAKFPCRRVVVLADPRRHVAVLAQDFADRAAILRQDTRVTVISGRGFTDNSEAGAMMVASRNQRGASRRTQRRGVEAIEAQTFGRQLVHRWRRHTAAKSAELTEARVIDQNQDNVRSAFRCLHRLRKLHLVRIEISPADIAGKMKVRSR